MSYPEPCEKCGATVTYLRSKYKPDVLEGVCLKCGKESKRVMYKCRSCGSYQPHRYVGSKLVKGKTKYGQQVESPVAVYECVVCKTPKTIFTGLRSPYERSMM